MGKFIYVFNLKDKDTLLSLNYVLLKSDDKNNIYVFENQDSLRFDAEDIKYVLTSTLTF